MNDWLKQQSGKLKTIVNRPRMSDALKQKLLDGKKHKVKTTGNPHLYVDGVKIYESKSCIKFDEFFIGLVYGIAISFIIWLTAILIALAKMG